MITGAANADVAILVVAAVTGEFEAGFTGGGQTKEHIMLARGLGVTQIIVAVNKLDVEGWKQHRYEEIKERTNEFLLKQQFKPKRIQFVPLSGLAGENVKSRSSEELSKWYKGPTLLEALNNFFPANRQIGTYTNESSKETSLKCEFYAKSIPLCFEVDFEFETYSLPCNVNNNKQRQQKSHCASLLRMSLRRERG